MAMADNVIRKACDRCHGQKLSCQRAVGNVACDRCLKLKAECTYSPSLRFKKHREQHHQQQRQHQLEKQREQDDCVTKSTTQPASAYHHHGPVVRSPKRHRTMSPPNTTSLVPPEMVSGTAAKRKTTAPAAPQSDVARATMSDLGGGYGDPFDQFSFFAPQPQQQQEGHLSQPVVHPGGRDRPQDLEYPALVHPWEQTLFSSSSAYQPTFPTAFNTYDNTFPQTSHQPLQGLPVSASTTTKTEQPSAGSGPSSSRRQAKQRLRQISLRHAAIKATSKSYKETHPQQHWMAQLADINASLLELSSALPPNAAAGRPPQLSWPGDEHFKANGFPIDEMFKLTRHVTDVLETLCSDGPGAARFDGSSDPGGSMFVLSTYVRLLDMYHRVFTLVRSELSDTRSKATFRYWKLPDVTVGSFAVQSSPPLQMSLTVQLAEEFLTRLRNSTATLEKTSARAMGTKENGGNGGSVFSDAVDTSYKAVRGREESLRRHLADLRAGIEVLLDS